jgi:hypothetical protein
LKLFLLRKLFQAHVWRQIFVERLSEPLHLNIASLFVAGLGSLRAKVAFDLLVRQQHAFGLLEAAEEAIGAGHRRVTVIEIGVANGAGLLNLCALGARITKETGIEFDFVGFDNASGMPPYRDYRDHPEMYQPGWYQMQDPDQLRAALPPNAKLILGDLTSTTAEYMITHEERSPIGFVSIDVDYYWSSAEALKCLTARALHYLPSITMYFDDIGGAGHNPWCGELLAIREFNKENTLRKIAPINFLRERRLFKNASWIGKMYFCHVFDHPNRLERLKNYGQVELRNDYLGIAGQEK